MDSKISSDKVSKELARELLIGISYSVPETDGNATKKINSVNGAAVAKGDGADKYRSELISISYESPDAQVPPPVVLENHTV